MQFDTIADYLFPYNVFQFSLFRMVSSSLR